MLEYLKLQNLGPAPELEFEFGPRINVLTGDNGLGKTFVLDLIWWVLTQTWADDRVIHPPLSPNESIVSYRHFPTKGILHNRYDRARLSWIPHVVIEKMPSPELIIYVRIDGGFSIWDPMRSERMHPSNALQFTQHQLWYGLNNEGSQPLCRGLLEDWETWRLKNNGAFHMLRKVLQKLSPSGNDVLLEPGESVRLPDSGAREVPTLVMPYGPVPLTHSSAGIRRILSLAYMIVWGWTEHRVHASLKNQNPTKRITLLWDEVESHLHPQWQRTIMPSVVGILESLLKQADGTQLQVIATTHAPLVLASLETTFKPETDRLFNLQLDKAGKVELEQIPWAKQGDVVEWLRSPAFDMNSGYSREAERALEAASDYLADRPGRRHADLTTRDDIEAELKRTLASEDPFWPRWVVRPGARA